MADSINTLKGMTAALAAKLKEHGITNTDQFLKAAATPAGRNKLKEQAGLHDGLLLELANRADLARINGVGGVFADMLEMAGVDTVKELAHRRADNLHAKLTEINHQKKLSSRTPSAGMCEKWVAEAKELPKVLEY